MSWILPEGVTTTNYTISYSIFDTNCFNVFYNDITTIETTYELKSVEDHGYIIDFGVENKMGFLSLSLSLSQDPFSVKMHCLVCLTTDYPITPPSFAVCIQTGSKKKEPHDIHVKVT